MSKKRSSEHPEGGTFCPSPERIVSIEGPAIPNLTDRQREAICTLLDAILDANFGPGSNGFGFRPGPVAYFVAAKELKGGKYNTYPKIKRAVKKHGIRCLNPGGMRLKIDKIAWNELLAREKAQSRARKRPPDFDEMPAEAVDHLAATARGHMAKIQARKAEVDRENREKRRRS
jgi:hypothetical protein